jgi:hypothetical protein
VSNRARNLEHADFLLQRAERALEEAITPDEKREAAAQLLGLIGSERSELVLRQILREMGEVQLLALLGGYFTAASAWKLEWRHDVAVALTGEPERREEARCPDCGRVLFGCYPCDSARCSLLREERQIRAARRARA